MFLLQAFLLFVHMSFAEPVKVDFAESFETCLPRLTLWEQLETALTESQNSPLWPNDLSTIKGKGIFDEAVIQVTYKSTFSSPTYSYRISEIVEESSFRYSAITDEHPFAGGATVSISEQEGQRTLTWQGEYLTPPGAWLERIFFQNYSRSFFSQLSDNIKLLEDEFCSLKNSPAEE